MFLCIVRNSVAWSVVNRAGATLCLGITTVAERASTDACLFRQLSLDDHVDLAGVCLAAGFLHYLAHEKPK